MRECLGVAPETSEEHLAPNKTVQSEAQAATSTARSRRSSRGPGDIGDPSCRPFGAWLDLGIITHDEDRERGRIHLVAISSAGENHYRLDFVEGGNPASVVLEYVPRKGVIVSHELSRLYEGRATAWEAVRALGKLIRGEAVDFPIAISEDGGDRPCS